MKTAWPIILVGVGIVLMALGVIWGFVFPASSSWTDEKANQMSELMKEARQLYLVSKNAKYKPKPGGPSPKEAEANYEAAKAKLDAMKEEFEGSRDSPKTVGTYFFWSGAGFILVGGMAVMASGRGD